MSLAVRRPPVTVMAACVLIVGLSLYAIAVSIFIVTRMQNGGGVMEFTFGFIGIKAAINIAVAVFIWRGQSWSRIAYAVLTALSLVMSWYAIAHFLLLGPVLQVASVVLLFVPASESWFARAPVPVMAAAPMADVQGPATIMAPAGGPDTRAVRPATLQYGVVAMFLVLGLEVWAACVLIDAWVATWPQDDSALAYLIFLIPVAGIVLAYIVVTVVLAVLVWQGYGAARFVYGAMTALGLRLVLGILSVAPAGAMFLYTACLGCFVLLFVPHSQRWFKARTA